MHPSILIKELDKYRTQSDGKALLYLALRRQRLNPQPFATMLNLGFDDFELYNNESNGGETPDKELIKYSDINQVVQWCRSMPSEHGNYAKRITFIAHLQNQQAVNLDIDGFSNGGLAASSSPQLIDAQIMFLYQKAKHGKKKKSNKAAATLLSTVPKNLMRDIVKYV